MRDVHKRCKVIVIYRCFTLLSIQAGFEFTGFLLEIHGNKKLILL